MAHEVQHSVVPFTYRFLGLKLRLAFTKRRFQKVEASYKRYLTAEGGDNDEDQHHVEDLLRVIEQTFGALRREIARIERGQEFMKRTAIPCVRTQMGYYRSYMVWLGGFRENKKKQNDDNHSRILLGDQQQHDDNNDESSSSDSAEKSDNAERSCCYIPMLQRGVETTTGIKYLIARFVGVPMGRLLHDLRSLEILLEQPTEKTNVGKEIEPSLEWLRRRAAARRAAGAPDAAAAAAATTDTNPL